MFHGKKPQYKFKTYKSDAAPFFFFIDIFPPSQIQFENPRSSFLANQIRDNPIMPLPMRIDRVFNGESSIIVRPNEPIVFPINESDSAIVNPNPFLQLGLEKLLFFTEIRSFENFATSLIQKKVDQWWDTTRFCYGNLSQIGGDFSGFLRAYLFTMIKAHINEGDIIGAAIEYCEIVNKICKDRLLRNMILVEINNKQELVKLYREKTAKYRDKLKRMEKTEYHPELIDIEVINLSENKELIETDDKNLNKYVLKFIPLLFYDDLQECMLQNLKLLETNEFELQSPSVLIDKNVIIIQKTEDLQEIELNEYNWLSSFSDLNIGTIYNSLIESLNLFINKEQEKFNAKF